MYTVVVNILCTSLESDFPWILFYNCCSCGMCSDGFSCDTVNELFALHILSLPSLGLFENPGEHSVYG